MSYYPNEAEPLWSHLFNPLNYSYSEFLFKIHLRLSLPRVAISVNGPRFMEWSIPMICFNGPRPEKDGTYSEGTKNGLISVVIHEVRGTIWFPMIVNSG